jgi:septal ring factor EnvC (AmiA/AmiB activator)
MPQLYGNPRKSELRSEISKLRSDLAEALTENRKLRRSLEWTWAAKTELELKIERMEASAKEALSIAAMDISGRISERIRAEKRARMESIAAEVFAEAAEHAE